MKPTRVAVLAALGMLLTSVSVYSLTPPGGIQIAAEIPVASAGGTNEDVAPENALPTEFAVGTTLKVEGRLGTKSLPKAGRGETFMLLELAADAGQGTTAAPANLSIVIDRSGSMKGTRLRNALQAALTAVDRLNDGDTVSVVAFDAKPLVVVTPTEVNNSSRGRIRSDILGIQLGGDTCISCGIEEGLSQLERTNGRVNRMILLSDGDATAGVRDIPGFRAMAQRARDRGASITTIGVDVEYNERILSSIALDSNGRHHFVANDSALERVFDEEARALTGTVASNAEASVELAPGVEIVRVVDRTFRKEGNRVVVPLGSFAGSEKKTVLVQVRVPLDQEGIAPVANVDVRFHDHKTGSEGRCGGKLAVPVTPTGTVVQTDSIVDARVNRTETADALKEANELFKQGRVDDARRRLETQRKKIAASAATAQAVAPKPRAADVDKDFKSQTAAVDDAFRGFATPPPAILPQGLPGGGAAQQPAPAPPQDTRPGKETVRQNAQRELEMRL